MRLLFLVIVPTLQIVLFFLLFSYTSGDLNNTPSAPPSLWKRCGRANSIHFRFLVRLFSVCRKCPNEEESLSSTEAPALNPNKNGNNWKITSARERHKRGLKQRRRGRQRERQNNNFARASRYLYISIPSLHDYNVKVPKFTFVEDGNTRQQLSFSFPELWHSPLEFNSEIICQHLTN